MRSPSTRVLVAAAEQYVDDARNEQNSLHTRYSAACAAMRACHLAGLTADEEVAVALDWETRRYVPSVVPSELEIDVIVATLERVLQGAPAVGLRSASADP